MTGSDRSDDGGPASEDDGTIRAEFDWSSRVPSAAVVETVAIAANAEPTAIEPLYDSVDPDALNALVRSDGVGPESGYVTVAFALAGHDVVVGSDGFVVVRPAS